MPTDWRTDQNLKEGILAYICDGQEWIAIVRFWRGLDGCKKIKAARRKSSSLCLTVRGQL
jgi:hypothetical protein